MLTHTDTQPQIKSDDERPGQGLELMDASASSALDLQERAMVDIQISTARRFPRSLAEVKRNIMSDATLDAETSRLCYYVLPPRKGAEIDPSTGKPKVIQGPSARLAEIALARYGNLRAEANVVADDGKFITAQGMCFDLQNNVAIRVNVKRRVTTKHGQRFSDDMVVVTGNAACSIALRNAIFKVVPMALIKPVYDACKKVAVGDGKTLVSRREAALSHFAKLGVSKERVFFAVGAKGIDDIGLEQLEQLIGLSTAIEEGETTTAEAFPDPKAAADASKPVFTTKEPKAGETTSAPAGETPLTSRTGRVSLATIADLRTRDGITDEELTAWARQNKHLNDVEELGELPAGKLRLIHDAWEAIAKDIVAARAS